MIPLSAAPLQIEGNEWVIVLLVFSLALIIAGITLFGCLSVYLKKKNDGFPSMTQKEKEQDERLM